jgi:hypothetical protein
MSQIALPIHADEKMYTSSRRDGKRSSAWKILPLLGLSAVGMIALHMHCPDLWSRPSTMDVESMCRQPSPAASASNWSSLYDYAGFKMESAKRLSGAIKIPTE